MRNVARLRTQVLRGLAGTALLLSPGPRGSAAPTPSLRLLISLKTPLVAQPEAARIVLHLHNATPATLWLYRRARGPHPQAAVVKEEGPSGCSTVTLTLEPADLKAAHAAATPAAATVLEYVGMPKPRLVKLPAGEDYEETSIVHLEPARTEGGKEIWGAYRLAVTYSAAYSNSRELEAAVGPAFWQGEVTGSAISLDLRPPLPDSTGVLGGTTLGPDLLPRAGIRVSLSDSQEQLVSQQVTGLDGKFEFTRLPLALYWVTGRREEAAEDTAAYHHEELTASSPTVTTQIVLYPPEIYDAKKVVHKPVLFRVTEPGGRAAPGVALDATGSNGEVIDDVRGVTDDEGMVALALIPGRSSVSLKQRGCREQVERADVAPGAGVDAFKFILDCARK